MSTQAEAGDQVDHPAHYKGDSLPEDGARWLPVPGYGSSYLVSDRGDVFSVRSGRLRAKTAWGPGHYFVINFYKDGAASKPFYIHRLVAELFLEPPTAPGMLVNHKNGNKHDNHVDNLEWVSWSQNNLHAYDTGLRQDVVTTAVKAADFTTRERRAIRRLLATGVGAEELAIAFTATAKAIHEAARAGRSS